MCRACQSIRQQKMRQKIRVIIADDHDCVRVGVKRVLQSAPHIECVGEAADTQGLAELLDACACDVVVSDISMPGNHGGSNAVSFLRRLLRGRSHPCVVVLTMICHAHMLSGLLHIGVGGIVDKRETVTALIDAIEAAFAGLRLSVGTRAGRDGRQPTRRRNCAPAC